MQSSIENYLRPLISDKQVAILGFGREGQSTYRTLRRLFGNIPLTVLDQMKELPESARKVVAGDQHLKVVLGNQSFSDLVGFDTIFKSPGVSPFLVELQDAVMRGAVVTSQTDVFFSVYGQQVVAVTGTKGKSTSCQVLTQVLKQAGKQVLFLGNIGAPAFEALEQVTSESIIVYETSSHQCEGLRHSPHIAVILNIYADHLDYYPSMESYIQAKRQLFINQKPTDLCLFNAQDERVVSDIVENLPGRKIGFSLEHSPLSHVFIDQDWLVAGGKKIVPTSEIPLLGSHNLFNVMPAIIVGLESGLDPADLRKYLSQVTPVEKRLEEVTTVNGITFVDDALATIPEATIAALSALGDRVETLIVGGFDRGQDFVNLAKVIAASEVANLILFPTTGEKIASLVKSLTPKISYFPVKTMDEAVKAALAHTKKGKTALLSTASASFGLFTDYRDRSTQLRECLNQASKDSSVERN